MNTRYKYPRTPHLPWSPGATPDDTSMASFAPFAGPFEGQKVVVTEKLDGENSTLYRDHIHARSVDSRHHPSRDWIKGFHATIAHQIPRGWRLCGENLYARHSIAYENLDSYFYLFSIWNEDNECLDWDETNEWASLLGLAMPRVMFSGLWDEKRVRNLAIDPQTTEGYVVRLWRGFGYLEFASSVAKWVRPGHVTTDQHWMNAAIVPNELRDSHLRDSHLRDS